MDGFILCEWGNHTMCIFTMCIITKWGIFPYWTVTGEVVLVQLYYYYIFIYIFFNLVIYSSILGLCLLLLTTQQETLLFVNKTSFLSLFHCVEIEILI